MNIALLNLLERILGKSKKANGDYYMFFSPFISHHNPKLNINITNGKWKCWKTQISGNSIYSLFKKLNVNKKYYKELNIIAPIHNFLTTKTDTNNTHTVKLPDEYNPLSIPRNDFAYTRSMNYLINRGITLGDIIYYNLGYCSSGEFKDSIIIPSYDVDRSLNYFIAKDINPGGRYKNISSKIIKKDEIIFFESNINWNFPVNLTEGVFDAITLKRNTIPLLGKTISVGLLCVLLRHNTKEVNIYLDNDVTYKEKEDLYNTLSKYNIKCNVIDISNGKDVNEVGYTSTIENSIIFDMSFHEQLKRRLNAR